MINTFAANEIPNRGGSDQQAFSDAMDAFIKKLTTLTIPQINAFADALNNYSFSATSTSNITIGTGIKNFVADLNKSFLPGMQLTMADAAAPADNLMLGNVISYVAGTGALSVKVKKYIGSGTKANWVISTAANAAFEQSRGALAMHATTMDLWSQPEVIDGTGAAVTMTNIAAAPQAGATRTLYPIASTVITHGATFDVQGNANYTSVGGDAFLIIAVTTTTFKVLIIKDDGTPLVMPTTKSPGELTPYSGTTPPAGHLACPTALTYVNATTYSALAFAIGTTWGNGGSTVNAGSFTVGNTYVIKTLGTTDFTLIGAASNTVGLTFKATGVGTGTGVANDQIALPYFPTGYAPVHAASGIGTATIGQMPSHSHSIVIHNATSGTPGISNSGSVLGTTQTGTAGSGTDNLAAGMKILWCVKY